MFLKRVYSEICVIRVQIFILVSLLCEFVTFRRKKGLDGKKYSVVIYEQIRFCEIKSNLNPHALSWYNNHLRERLTFLAQELEKITADLPVWG